ncbi:hypothetical protein BST11_02750 [Mycobacterium alsense]|uniref:NlpC/P60 domain-containing protein n=1 Tax=Mycobacterium alsense TaxID=324058 RepID=A0AA42BWU6_9MYCO|nr:hypothetical protein [Mycobacterium alsense]MCV7377559.1 hypothetical protein [Mycobacterium alsense]OQZ92932.1 hypothetical protein BST11_02750 [Mycobacterium alsense]
MNHRLAFLATAALALGLTIAVPANADTTAKEDRAVAWANSKVGSNDYVFACGRFVANAYGEPGLGYPSALAFHDHLAATKQIHMDTDIPKGALVFSQSPWDIDGAGHQGHVVIARGDGTFVSGGVDQSSQLNVAGVGGGSTVQIFKSWNPAPGAEYLGWAPPPATWPGV